MSWDRSISSEIASLFAELDGADEYDRSLQEDGAYRRRKAVERVADWRKNNPERFAQLRRESVKRWRQRNPEKRRAQRKRYHDKHRTRLREKWRTYQAAYRARKRAA